MLRMPRNQISYKRENNSQNKNAEWPIREKHQTSFALSAGRGTVEKPFFLLRWFTFTRSEVNNSPEKGTKRPEKTQVSGWKRGPLVNSKTGWIICDLSQKYNLYKIHANKRNKTETWSSGGCGHFSVRRYSVIRKHFQINAEKLWVLLKKKLFNTEKIFQDLHSRIQQGEYNLGQTNKRQRWQPRNRKHAQTLIVKI